MPRKVKCRKVCHYPQTLEFLPQNNDAEQEPIILTVDEYETIRLIDRRGMSQEQCAAFMQIARTTVQRIYETARKKLADFVVEGRLLRIEGGDFRLCNGSSTGCGCVDCFKQKLYKKYKEKGEDIMRIAVTYENGEIFQHFGHTEEFKVYDAQDGKVVAFEVVNTNGQGHGALAGVLTALKLYGGVSGSADAAVEALLAGKLDYNPAVKCNHHGEGHTCGEHGCGGHN